MTDMIAENKIKEVESLRDALTRSDKKLKELDVCIQELQLEIQGADRHKLSLALMLNDALCMREQALSDHKRYQREFVDLVKS